MNNNAMFFDSRNGDRQYSAEDFRAWLSAFFDNGVVSGELFVESTGTMTVYVQGGHAIINGAMMDNKDPYELEIDVADNTYDRIDNIVVEFNNTEDVRDVLLKVVKGDPVESPEPFAPVRTEDVYQLIIARVKVKAGATVIKQSDIEDTRGYKDICGMIVNQKSKEVADEVYKHAKSKTEEFYARNFTEYNEWFAGIKETFEGDVAAEFNAQVDAMNARNEEIRIKQNTEGTKTLNNVYTFDQVVNSKTGLYAVRGTETGSALASLKDSNVREIVLLLGVKLTSGGYSGRTIAIISTPNGLPGQGSNDLNFTVTYMTTESSPSTLKTSGDVQTNNPSSIYMVKQYCKISGKYGEKNIGGETKNGWLRFGEITKQTTIKGIGGQNSYVPELYIIDSIIMYSNNGMN